MEGNVYYIYLTFLKINVCMRAGTGINNLKYFCT